MKHLVLAAALAAGSVGYSVAVLGNEGEAPQAAPAAASTGIIKNLQVGIPHEALFGLSLHAGSGVAVGAGGEIRESTDAGQTWKAVEKLPTNLALLSVDRRGQHTIAVGQMGAVVVKDGTGDWTKVESPVPGRLLTVSVNANGLAIAGGEFGTVIVSKDGGKTWSEAKPDWASMADADAFGTGEPNIYASYVDEAGAITIAGEFGVMVRSLDQGQTWRVLHTLQAKFPTIFAMTLAAEGQGTSYAVGQSGLIMESNNYGEGWAVCDSGQTANFLGVAAAPNGHVVITGMRAMTQSKNGGHTWEAIEEGDTLTDWYQAVRADPTSSRILAVGHSGKIIQIGS